ncbi:hypothetical protein Tco_1377364 [Tanacetum coccineum]
MTKTPFSSLPSQNDSPTLPPRVYLQSPSPPSYNPLRDQMINQLHNISTILDSHTNPSNSYIHAPSSPPPQQIHPPSHAQGNYGVDTKSFAFVLKTNHVKPSASIDPTPAIVLNESCIQEKNLSCIAIGKIIDINALPNLYAILNNEGFDNVKLSYLGGYWVLIKSFSIASKEKLIKHVGVLSWFSELGHANNSFVSDVRLVWISIEGLPICVWNKDALAKIVSPWGTLSDVDVVDDASFPFQKVCVVTKASTIINDTIKIIVKGKIYWIRIRELEAWTLDFDDEFCDTSSGEESMREEKNVPIQEQDLDHVSESSCMKENNEFEFNGKAHTQEIQSKDPFKIYDLLNKKDTLEDYQSDDP